MPLISVVMASYNHEQFISETIESVLNQSFRDIELVIVEDCSKDNSGEIVRAYQEKDGRLRAVFHGENKGIAKTFNDGIDQATGKFLAIIGSDDLWVEDKLEKQMKILRENEDLIVHSGAVTIDAKGDRVERPAQKRRIGRKREKSGNVFGELLAGNFVCGSSIIFKKSNLNGIRFDERYRYVNDYKFTLDLARKYEFHFIPEALVKYRVHGGNITLRDEAGWLEDFASFGKELLEKYDSEFSSRARANFLFKIASDARCRGDMADAAKYILRAISKRPFMAKYWRFLLSSVVHNLRHRKTSVEKPQLPPVKCNGSD